VSNGRVRGAIKRSSDCDALRIHSRQFQERYKAAAKFCRRLDLGRAALQQDHKKVDFDQYRIAHVLSQWIKGLIADPLNAFFDIS
jgi:hypothetical protein